MTGDESTACAELEQDLVLFHYGELNGAERQRVGEHLKGCAACAQYLTELGNLLPKTLLTDEPPQAFWNDYGRELRQKLAELGVRESRWRKLISAFQPWAMPALATSALVALVLTFALGKGIWLTRDTPPPAAEAILEVLPLAENLDFYRNLEVLDTLELLELMSEQSKGAAEHADTLNRRFHAL